MRIWHNQLIPKLCQKHLCAMWREGLGCYKIITENKKGYRNHPAAKEWIGFPELLWYRLENVRDEMVKRGYHPKETPECIVGNKSIHERPKEWQTLKEQVEILKAKGCKCVL